jgi:hypothetical protein
LSLKFCLIENQSPAAGLASAVVQSNFKDVAKPCPVGTSVDCDCVQVPKELKPKFHLSTV